MCTLDFIVYAVMIISYISYNIFRYGLSCAIKHNWVEDGNNQRTGGIGFTINYACSNCQSTKIYKESAF